MAIQAETKTIAVAGSAGSAVGAEEFGLATPSRLVGVEITYTSQPATCVVTIKSTGDVVFTTPATNTAKRYRPRDVVQNAAGADQAAVFDLINLDGALRAEVATGNAGSVSVTIFVRTD